MLQKAQPLLLTLLAVALLAHPISSQTANTTVPLNTPLSFSQSSQEQKYYQTTISNPSSQEVLMITVAADIQAYIGIFVSTSNSKNFSTGTWPSWDSYTEECFYSSVDTCALRMPDIKDLPSGQTDLIVYFTVTVGSDCTYTLDVSLQTIYPVKVGGKYSVSFSTVESAVVELPGANFVTAAGGVAEQIVVECIYYSYRDIGRFQLLAEEDKLPSPKGFNYLKSKSLNAFTQILQLPPPQSLNSSYFILLQGENGTRFNFTIRQIPSVSNPSLSINQTISYLSQKQITYSYHSLFVNTTANTTLKPLVLELYLYRGYGKFYINYCNDQYNFTFESVGGESGEIVLTGDMRKQCYSYVMGKGGLLVENLVVGVKDIVVQVGYTIGLYEGVYDWYLITGMKEMGVLETASEVETYDVATYGNNTSLTLTAQVYVGNVTVTVLQCQRNSTNSTTCMSVASANLTQSVSPLSKLNFTCPAKSTCQIQVQQTPQPAPPSAPAKYSLYLSYTNKASTELLPNSPQYDLVQMNAYNFYSINVSALRAAPQYNFSNVTIINIRNTVINGDTVLLASPTIEFPVFKDLFKVNSDVVYGWEGSISFVANASYPAYIYVSVLGDTESIYHLQYTLNTTPNIPAAYQSLIDDAQNDYTLSQGSPYTLLKYISHIIPYTITFNPQPNCIMYGNKLPIPTLCAGNSLPTSFTDPVLYFNVSQAGLAKGAVFKFGVYVGSGEYGLEEDRPILIACDKQCYEIVNVLVNSTSATILHSGDGRITLLSGNQTASNSPLTLTCSSPPCTIKLNATLRYGGSMELAFESTGASQVEWRTKPTTLPALNSYKYFYMEIPKYSEFTSLIFYAQAADLTVYYSLQALDESYTNTINYKYPSLQSNMGVSYGDPLQEIHVVDIDEDILESMKCRTAKVVCVVTLAVVLNTSVEYSSQYVSQGFLYYSSNIYQYDISQQWPLLRLKQSYSLAYFSHTLNFTSEQTTFPYTIHLQPLSNCRPQIQTESTLYLRNHYTDVTLPLVMPGQTKINFRVVANQVCVFDVALTNLGYQLVFPGMLYALEVGKGRRVVAVYQHTDYNGQFTVAVKDKVDSIVVGKVKYTTGKNGEPVLVLPTVDSPDSTYVSNTTSLTLKSAQTTEYLIVIQLPQSYSHATLPLTVTLPSQPLTLLHNQEQSYTYDPTDNSISALTNSTIEYEYYSTSNFYIFVSVNRIQVRVTVRDATVWGQEGEIMSILISNQSDPWIYIDGSNNPDEGQNTKRANIDIMTHYKITCEFVGTLPPGSKSTLRLHIEEVGIAGLIQLYEGVSTYDAFVHGNAMNCYKLITPMILGEDTIDVDLNFMDVIRELEEYNETAIAATASLNEQSKATPLLPKLLKISPTTYRLTLSFLPAQAYKICFTLTSPYMLGTEYSVVANMPSTPMLYNYQFIDVSAIYADQYSTFEYVNYYGGSQTWLDERDVDIVVSVVNCVGQSVLLGSGSYQDVLAGGFTSIGSGWASNGVNSVLVDVPHGYYYFAVKPATTGNPNQLFRVSIQQAPKIANSTFIPHTQYIINWHLKATLDTEVVQNVEYVVLRIPPVIRAKSINGSQISNAFYSPTKIVYSLYLLNLVSGEKAKSSYKYSIDAYTRCPALYNASTANTSTPSHIKANPGLKPIQTVVMSAPYEQNTADNMVQFKLTIEEFGKESNISVKAQVFLIDENGVPNVIEYFYGQEEILVLSDDSTLWRPLKWIFYLCLFIMALGGIAFAYRFYMKRKAERTINFQMTDSSQPGRELEQRRSQPSAPIRPADSAISDQPVDLGASNVSSNRRPLNNSVGYGQFIDEV